MDIAVSYEGVSSITTSSQNDRNGATDELTYYIFLVPRMALSKAPLFLSESKFYSASHSANHYMLRKMVSA